MQCQHFHYNALIRQISLISLCWIADVTFGQYTNTNGCENVDGGGWQLVRHVSASDNNVHPARDNLAGTALDVYGTYDTDAQSSVTWSIQFNNINYNQFLFAWGDCTKWLVTTKEQAIGNQYWSADRCILASSQDNGTTINESYYAMWTYGNSAGQPWLSINDISQCSSNSETNCIVYGEDSYTDGYVEWGFANHAGGNVWIRYKEVEKRVCDGLPTIYPSVAPSKLPTLMPTKDPTVQPTIKPSYLPTVLPTNDTTVLPSVIPTLEPSVFPTFIPTSNPTLEPSEYPTSIEPTMILTVGHESTSLISTNVDLDQTLETTLIANNHTNHLQDSARDKSSPLSSIISLSEDQYLIFVVCVVSSLLCL